MTFVIFGGGCFYAERARLAVWDISEPICSVIVLEKWHAHCDYFLMKSKYSGNV